MSLILERTVLLKFSLQLDSTLQLSTSLSLFSRDLSGLSSIDLSLVYLKQQLFHGMRIDIGVVDDLNTSIIEFAFQHLVSLGLDLSDVVHYFSRVVLLTVLIVDARHLGFDRVLCSTSNFDFAFSLYRTAETDNVGFDGLQGSNHLVLVIVLHFDGLR